MEAWHAAAEGRAEASRGLLAADLVWNCCHGVRKAEDAAVRNAVLGVGTQCLLCRNRSSMCLL